MKKSTQSIIAFAAASLLAAGLAFAAAANTEAKPAGCCTKAKADGKTCTHSCCVESAKAGDNCTKCKGAGKVKDNPKK